MAKDNRKVTQALYHLQADCKNGQKIIGRACRDAGYEVVCTSLHHAPEQIVSTAIQEEVELIGLSCLSGVHMHLFSEVLKLLREKGIDNITVIASGIIPGEDVPKLKEAGIREVFLLSLN